MKRALIGVVLGVLLGASAAHGATIQQDYELAGRYWGVASPPDCASVEIREMTPDEELGVEGFATKPEWEGTECVFALSAHLLPYPRCVASVHEYGHLIGLGHSPDPANVMYEQTGFQRVGLCMQQRRENLESYCTLKHGKKRARCFRAAWRETLPWIP